MTQRLYQHLASQLKQEFSGSEFTAGTRLPTERDYAQRFDVSRTVVREAFIMLEIEGWVEIRKGSGTYLLERPTQPSPFAVEEIGPFELLDARQTVESAIAALAAQRISKTELRSLSQLLQHQGKILASTNMTPADFSDLDTIDQEIHTGIARASQNTLLEEVVQQLWNQHKSTMWAQLHERIPDFTYLHEWYSHHENIISMLRKRDEEGARQAMWSHIQRVKEVLFELSDTNDPEFDGFLFENGLRA